MLIGGPNQSHKVNFKEPVRVTGKISKRTFVICSVNAFPETFEKRFWKNRSVSPLLRATARVWREGLNEGNREDANRIFLIKTFLNINDECIITHLLSCYYQSLFLVVSWKKHAHTRPHWTNIHHGPICIHVATTMVMPRPGRRTISAVKWSDAARSSDHGSRAI